MLMRLLSIVLALAGFGGLILAFAMANSNGLFDIALAPLTGLASLALLGISAVAHHMAVLRERIDERDRPATAKSEASGPSWAQQLRQARERRETPPDHLI